MRETCWNFDVFVVMSRCYGIEEAGKWGGAEVGEKNMIPDEAVYNSN